MPPTLRMVLRFAPVVLSAAGIAACAQNAPVAAAVVPIGPAFEVSAVKHNGGGSSGSHSSTQNGRYTASNVTVEQIIAGQAYGISDERVMNAPKWVSSDRWDIQAKVDDDLAAKIKDMSSEQRRDTFQHVFQAFLADRFKLAAHWETRTMPNYSLVVSKKGAHLTPSTQKQGGASISVHNTALTAKNITLEDLARALTQDGSRELGRIVVDHTGIEGRYDVSLTWSADSGNAGGSAADSADAGPSIFTAVEEQLGLKLESSKGPVEVLVIDHVELPSEN